MSDSDVRSEPENRLFNLLPGIIRRRDAEERSALKALLDVIHAEVGRIETDIVGMRALSARREGDLSPSVRALLSKSWAAESFTDAITARKKAVQAMAQFMTRFDLILTPTVPAPT